MKKAPSFEPDAGINFEAPVLVDAETGEAIRNATEDETARSREARRPGAEKGIIEVDGTRCYVADWSEMAAGADRRVDGPGLD